MEKLENNSSTSADTSKHAMLYKIAKTPSSQTDRREKLLQEMKLRRDQTVNAKRGLLEVFAEDELNQCEDMDVETRNKKQTRNYSRQMMTSEWFREIPHDLESNWLVKLCPIGKRNLVVARKNTTRAYKMNGQCVNAFQSELPGGSVQLNKCGNVTILDCIYNGVTKCYYVLDVVVWHNRSYQDCDTDFRFFLLQSKLEETPRLQQINVLNKHRFFHVPYFPAQLPLIEDELSHLCRINGEVVPLDGVLFYHRQTQYISKINPLFGWLKPFMVPEMLHVTIHEEFLKDMPENYVSLEDYLKNLPQRHRKKFNLENSTVLEMETEATV